MGFSHLGSDQLKHMALRMAFLSCPPETAAALTQDAQESLCRNYYGSFLRHLSRFFQSEWISHAEWDATTKRVINVHLNPVQHKDVIEFQKEIFVELRVPPSVSPLWQTTELTTGKRALVVLVPWTAGDPRDEL